ncbi:MAG: ABC transporter substrate-binding protein [Defluviitaleaceae bacterium]|nr:ABC transporter substrate-binding protein [Defluviitaleaceae bacterium]
MEKLGKFLTLLLLGLVLKGCGGGFSPAPIDPYFGVPTTTVPATTQPIHQLAHPPEPAQGGHLQIAMPMPQTLNPLLNSERELAQVLRLLFEPLVVMDEDLRPHPNPNIVESITFTPSGQAFTITLHDDIFWEDGTPIRAADIAFSIDVLRNHAPETAVYRPNVASIVSHSIIDPRSLHVNLYAPKWQMMYLLDFPIIPAHYYTGVPMTNLRHPRNMHPVGNGAFRFYSYVLVTRMELIANDNAPGGRPYIDRVTATVMRDMSDTVHAFERGIIDILEGSASIWGRLRAFGKNSSGTMVSGSFDFIGFNHGRGTFNDVKMRRAIGSVFHAHQLPIRDEAWFAATIPAHAHITFAELGFVMGEYGILERELSPILPPFPLAMTIIVNEDNPRTPAMAGGLSVALRAAGADVSLHILPAEMFAHRLYSGEFDLVVGTKNIDIRPNLEFLRGYNRAYGNLMGFNSVYFNRLLDNMNLATNPISFQESVHAVQVYMVENLPILGIGFEEMMFFTSSRLHGNLAPAGNDIFRNSRSWFILG